MKTWLDEVSASLDEAIKIAESERIPLQSLYRLAPALFALKHGIQDEGLIQQMLDEADAQVTEDASGMCQPHLNQPAIN